MLDLLRYTDSFAKVSKSLKTGLKRILLNHENNYTGRSNFAQVARISKIFCSMLEISM